MVEPFRRDSPKRPAARCACSSSATRCTAWRCGGTPGAAAFVAEGHFARPELLLLDPNGGEQSVLKLADDAAAQRLERVALQGVAANSRRPDEERGEGHEREAEQELALERHTGLPGYPVGTNVRWERGMR